MVLKMHSRVKTMHTSEVGDYTGRAATGAAWIETLC